MPARTFRRPLTWLCRLKQRGWAPWSALLCFTAVLWSGCDEDCCVYDGAPIQVLADTEGALWMRIRSGGEVGWALVDTSAPVNRWHDPRGAKAQLRPRSFEVLAVEGPAEQAPVRARFRDIWMLGAPLQPSPDPVIGTRVLAILGGEFWRNFAPILTGAADAGLPSVTVWDRQPAGTGFLDRAQYAVLEANLYGGGQLNADGKPDVFGLRGPHQFSGSQLLLRGCAAPDPFDPVTAGLPTCCRGDERRLATGADIALVLATGVGGVVFSEAAWTRVATRLGLSPLSTDGPGVSVYHPARSEVLTGKVVSLPRLAFVNREVPVGQDPGACVELGRARRTELVAMSQWRSEWQSSSTAACPPRCDRDPSDVGRGMSSAAYFELGGPIEVIVVPDGAPLLQALRAEIRPEGPEIDGLLGASALKSLRIELDYGPRPARMIVSCRTDDKNQCRAVGRCPRIPDQDSKRVCFDLPAHGLPETCDNPELECQ